MGVFSIFFYSSIRQPTTAVYQVTRTGHDNCDITEGVLLDINPLKVDNRKVVTLYDKDLTEGINLLIGKNVSAFFAFKLGPKLEYVDVNKHYSLSGRRIPYRIAQLDSIGFAFYYLTTPSLFYTLHCVIV